MLPLHRLMLDIESDLPRLPPLLRLVVPVDRGVFFLERGSMIQSVRGFSWWSPRLFFVSCPSCSSRPPQLLRLVVSLIRFVRGISWWSPLL